MLIRSSGLAVSKRFQERRRARSGKPSSARPDGPTSGVSGSGCPSRGCAPAARPAAAHPAARAKYAAASLRTATRLASHRSPDGSPGMRMDELWSRRHLGKDYDVQEDTGRRGTAHRSARRGPNVREAGRFPHPRLFSFRNLPGNRPQHGRSRLEEPFIPASTRRSVQEPRREREAGLQSCYI